MDDVGDVGAVVDNVDAVVEDDVGGVESLVRTMNFESVQFLSNAEFYCMVDRCCSERVGVNLNYTLYLAEGWHSRASEP